MNYRLLILSVMTYISFMDAAETPAKFTTQNYTYSFADMPPEVVEKIVSFAGTPAEVASDQKAIPTRLKPKAQDATVDAKSISVDLFHRQAQKTFAALALTNKKLHAFVKVARSNEVFSAVVQMLNEKVKLARSKQVASAIVQMLNEERSVPVSKETVAALVKMLNEKPTVPVSKETVAALVKMLNEKLTVPPSKEVVAAVVKMLNEEDQIIDFTKIHLRKKQITYLRILLLLKNLPNFDALAEQFIKTQQKITRKDIIELIAHALNNPTISGEQSQSLIAILNSINLEAPKAVAKRLPDMFKQSIDSSNLELFMALLPFLTKELALELLPHSQQKLAILHTKIFQLGLNVAIVATTEKTIKEQEDELYQDHTVEQNIVDIMIELQKICPEYTFAKNAQNRIKFRKKEIAKKQKILEIARKKEEEKLQKAQKKEQKKAAKTTDKNKNK